MSLHCCVHMQNRQHTPVFAPTLPLIPVIAGPTAGGKSSLALAVANALGKIAGAADGLDGSGEAEAAGQRVDICGCVGVGEVISADAFQVYRGMDIGTGKVTAAEMGSIRHHLIDVVEPDDAEPFTVARWLALAQDAVDAIRARGHVPIVAGGTHLYIKAFLEGMFAGPGADEAIRNKYRAMEPDRRRQLLEKVDPLAAARIHPNDDRRTVRALEVFELTGKPISEHQTQWDRQQRPDARLFVLDWPTEAINRRINARVKAMVRAGLVEEVAGLLEAGKLGSLAAQALGYKQLIACMGGHEQGAEGARGGVRKPTQQRLDEAIEQIKIETRRFAKNQRTWLKRLGRIPGTVVLKPAEMSLEDMAQVVVNTCFSGNDQQGGSEQK